MTEPTDTTEILLVVGENQHLMTLMDAARQFILSTDDCSRETFMGMAGGAYDATEQQIVMHTKALET